MSRFEGIGTLRPAMRIHHSPFLDSSQWYLWSLIALSLGFHVATVSALS